MPTSATSLPKKRRKWKAPKSLTSKRTYTIYIETIEELQSISVNELEDIVLPNEAEIVNKIFVDVKSAIQKEIAENQKRQEDEDLNAIPITKPSKISQVSDEEYIEMLSKKQSETDTLPAEEIAAEEETEDQPVNSNTAKEEATSKE